MNDLPELERIIATPTDRERLLALITEHAALLREATDSERNRRMRAKQNVHIVFQLAMAGLTLWFATGDRLWFELRWAWGLLPQVVRADDIPRAHFFLGILAAAWLVVAAIDIWVLRIDRDPTTKRLELRPLFAALERLVSRAAFLENHADLSSDERLRFQVRIGEAESALESTDRVLRRRPWFLCPHSLLRMFGLREKPWTTRHYRTRTRSL